MIKHLNKLFLALALISFSMTAFAGDISPTAKESKQGTISATDTEATTILGRRHVVLVNRGANEVFIRFNSTTAASASDFELKTDEILVVDADEGSQFYNIRTKCATAETTSLQYLAWN